MNVVLPAPVRPMTRKIGYSFSRGSAFAERVLCGDVFIVYYGGVDVCKVLYCALIVERFIVLELKWYTLVESEEETIVSTRT
jgi:hypothetical protein